MTPASLATRSDRELLQLSEAVLTAQGFHVENIRDGVDLLIAENRYFIIAVAAMNTISNLILAEPLALETLAKRIEAVALGSKKWDTYLVLLTQERSAEDDEVTRDIYSINYDTSRLRRIAHTGVDATREAVEHALAPFVEPATPVSPEASSGALELLLEALVAHGVDEEVAHRAIRAFEQGATLDDIL